MCKAFEDQPSKQLINVGVLIYIYIYICLWTEKKFESYLAIDSPFQTFAVGLHVEFID